MLDNFAKILKWVFRLFTQRSKPQMAFDFGLTAKYDIKWKTNFFQKKFYKYLIEVIGCWSAYLYRFKYKQFYKLQFAKVNLHMIRYPAIEIKIHSQNFLKDIFIV